MELDANIRRATRATLRTAAIPPPDAFLQSSESFLAAWDDHEEVRPAVIGKYLHGRITLDLAFSCFFLFARRGRLFRWAVRSSRLQIQYVLPDIISEARLTLLKFSALQFYTQEVNFLTFFFDLLSFLTKNSESIPIMGVRSLAGESHHSTTSSCYLSQTGMTLVLPPENTSYNWTNKILCRTLLLTGWL